MTLHLRDRRPGGALIGVLLAALLAGCSFGTSSVADDGVGTLVTNGERGWRGTPVADGYPLPDLEFTTTGGDTTMLPGVANAPVTLVFFGYSHCPDTCNIVLANFAAALRGATPTVRKAVRMVFVTTDPARDSPPVVRRYLDRFDTGFEGLVAPVDTVAMAAKALYISYEKPDGTVAKAKGNYQVDHGTYTTAFLRGRARVVWSSDTTVADLRADLTRLTRLARLA